MIAPLAPEQAVLARLLWIIRAMPGNWFRLVPAPKSSYLRWLTACHAKAHCMRLIVISHLANRYDPARLLVVPDYDYLHEILEP
jgi:hypothetical protein